MATVSDEKFRALRGLGHTGAMNDMTLQWLHDGGATSPCLNDAWLEWLSIHEPLGSFAQRNDWWHEYLVTAGYDLAAGSTQLNDMELAFWAAQ